MKCEHLNNILKKRFDIDLLEGGPDHDHLLSVYHHYRDQKAMYGYLGESVMSPHYSKAYLISEAALMILREIAPKRINRKKKKKG